MTKVGIVGSNGIPANYGGLETLVENLTKILDEKFDITVYCSRHNRLKFPKSFGRAKLIYSRLKANGWQSVPYDILTTIHALIKNDVVILMGPGVGFVLIINKILNKKIIVNHGGLDEWNREKYSWFERKFLYYSTKYTAALSNINVADNLVLSESLKKNFQVKSVVIRYGGDYGYFYDGSVIEKYADILKFGKYFISVSRAQVDNNLHVVLDAFISSQQNLVLISNWSISEYGRELYEKYNGKFSNIKLLNAIYDKNEIGYLRDKAFAYIHSHSRCGTAPSLVEAMWQDKFPICFDVETNRETTFYRSKYFKSSEDLRVIVEELDSEEINKFKNENIKKIKDDYNWGKIGEQYSVIINE
jgi:hypothetical protein